jgi:uncharacterized protein (UPF0332 family)
MPPRPAASHLEKLPPLLRGAAVLLDQGLWEPAVHALYYACLHAALALLSTAGISATTHRGIGQVFGLHFVKDGPLPGHFGRLLAQLMTDRELADYGVAREIAPEVAQEAARRAVEFLRLTLPLVAQRDSAASEAAAAAAELLEGVERAAGS